jgi:hypothetical protein
MLPVKRDVKNIYKCLTVNSETELCGDGGNTG